MSINLTVVIDNDEAIRKFRELQKTAKTVTSSVITDADRMDAAMQRFMATLGKIGVGVSLAGLVKQIAQTRGEFQQLEVAFTTLLQSKEKADALMSQMVDLAAKTPFDLQGVASGARQLLAYGFAAEDITDTLTRLGNVAAGLGLNLQDLTWLYGTTAVQGRLYTRDVMQFQSRGIDLAGELATQLGKTRAEINQMVTDGKIGFPEVQKAIESMTNEGGKFYNLMQEQSKTITGLISNLGDAIDMMFNDIGKSQEGVIAGVLQGTISLVENYQKVLDVLIPLVAAYGTYKAALIAVAAAQKVQATIEATKAILEQTKMLTRATQAQILFNKAVKANPYVLAASALVALIAAISRFSNRAKEAAENAESLAKVNKMVAEQTDEEAARIKSLQDIVNNSNVAYSERKRALDELKGIVPDYHASLTSEGKLINNNTEAIKNYIKAFERSVKLRAVRDELEEAYRQQRKDMNEAEKIISAGTGTTSAGIYGGPSNVHTMRREYTPEEKKKIRMDAYLKTAPIIRELNDEIVASSLAVEDSTGKTIINVTENLKDAQKAYSDAKTALDKARRDGSDISVVKEKQNAVDSAKKALDEAKKLAGVDDKTIKATTKSQKELSDAILANDLALQKSRVDILKDGREKRLAGIDLENRQTIEKIEKERLEAIEAAKKGGGTLSKEENSKFDARIDNANIYTKNQVDSINKEYADDLEDTYRKITSVFLSEEEKKRAGIKKTYDDWRKEAQESLEAGNITQQQYDDLMGYLGQAEDFESIKNALDEFETFQEKKVRIAKEYDDKIADIQKRNTEGQFDANIKEAERQKKEAIDAINKEVADREGVFSDWADSILNMGLKKLEKKLTEAKDILATQGDSLSDEEKAMLEAKIAALEKQIKAAKRNKETGKQSIENWKDTATAMNAVAESARNIIENIDGIDEGFKNAISDVVDFSDGMGQMSNAVAGIKESLNNKDTLGAITGIAGAVSLGIGLVTKLFSLFKRKDYMAEFRKEVEKLNRELARTKLQASLDDDGSQTIFGDNTWENAKKNVNALNVALQTYNKTLGSIADRKQYSGLFAILADFRGIKSTFDNASESIANMQVKIRHSTWFRSAKYTSLKDAVPELFNNDGSVNMDALEKFIGTDTFKKLSDENQQYLQNMSEDWEVYQDALEKVKDYLSGIFGDLGNTMTDALVDAFASGTDAAEAFADSVSEMLEKLGKQMIYSVTLAPVMDKAQEKMMEIMKNEGLSDQSKFNSYVSILDQLIGDVEEQQGAFNSLLEQYQNIASGKGFDIFTPDSSTSQEASSGEFQTLSQDTGKELNGRFTAIQEYTANIRDDVRLILAQNGQKLNEMTNIRDIAIQLNGNVAIIKGHTSHLEEMDDKLGRMVKIMNEKL